MEFYIGENIRSLRKSRDISQETIANEVGVSVQAVSKWETGQSLPDVGLLPVIADFFGVSIDSLFFGEEASVKSSISLPHDNVLYIVQVKNGRVLGKDNWSRNNPIKLAINNNSERINNSDRIDIRIWGNAEIDGDISGNVEAGDGVNCGSVGGNINAGDGVICGSVGGNINAGDGVICGSVGGCVNAGDGINCGGVGGSLNAKGDIHCGDVQSADKISCETLYVKGSVNCNEIKCSGDIHSEEKLNVF